MRLFRCLFLLLLATAPVHAEEPVRVFAAASLTTALDEIADAWRAHGHPRPVLAYAGSSALAKQIAAGAPADLFASADRSWMDYVAERGRIDATTRVDLLGNTLVLVAPKGRAFVATLERGTDLAGAFEGRLCTGEPGVVPVGIYAQQALSELGQWDALQPRIVGSDDVRAALAFIERGECAAGIVYATDARASDEVELVGTFPADSHAPIVYPFARVKGARTETGAFLAYLQGDAARASFERHGFVRLAR
jgi:molybdate transport system substrate-binding protein